MERLRFVFTVAIVAACGGTTTNLGTTDGGSSSGAAIDAGGATDSSVDPQADVVVGPSFAVCSSNADCLPTEWCARTDGVCGGNGNCVLRPPPPPPGCPAAPDLYCGCNGNSYCSKEDGHAIGVDIAVFGSCTQPCGPNTCHSLTEYCDHGSGGAALPDSGANEAWSCKTYAAAGCLGQVESRTCACVQLSPSAKGEACNEVGGHVQVEHFWP